VVRLPLPVVCGGYKDVSEVFFSVRPILLPIRKNSAIETYQ